MIKDYIIIVLHKTEHSYGYYDVRTGNQKKVVPTNPFPHEVCLSPDRKKIYIAEMGVRGVESEGKGGHTVSVFETKSGQKLSTIDTGRYDRPHGVVAHKSGRLLVTSESTKHLLIYDIETEKVQHAVDLDQEYAHMVSVAPDGTYAYTANIGSDTISQVNIPEGKVVRHIPVLRRPEGMVFSQDGDFIYVVNRESNAIAVVDTDQGKVVDEISTGYGPVRIVITPDGNSLIIPLFFADKVQRIDPKSHAVSGEIKVGRRPAGIAISRDGKLIFVACEEENKVYTIKLPSFTILNTIATDPGCDAMVCLDKEAIT